MDYQPSYGFLKDCLYRSESYKVTLADAYTSWAGNPGRNFLPDPSGHHGRGHPIALVRNHWFLLPRRIMGDHPAQLLGTRNALPQRPILHHGDRRQRGSYDPHPGLPNSHLRNEPHCIRTAARQ